MKVNQIWTNLIWKAALKTENIYYQFWCIFGPILARNHSRAVQDIFESISSRGLFTQ